MQRVVTHSYRDPLSELWMCAAKKLGMRVARTEHAFAHSDGKGNLEIASDEHLDPDDCLAQMIFHEICHSLVAGPDSFSTTDWGLDNTGNDDDEIEHATLRVQAILAGRYGLREVFAPTTDFRAFYDALGPDPLVPRDSVSTKMALPAIARAQTNPWAPYLARALEDSAAIIAIAAKWPAPSDAPGLYRRYHPAQPLHESGLFARSPKLSEQCGDCAWRQEKGHCHQADALVEAHTPACERFEQPFDCLDCGACCRGAYHSVTINHGDRIAERHPQLLIHHQSYSEVKREGDHCAALNEQDEQFVCSIYEDRPTCCRDFENAGQNCLTARRRLGLSL